MNRRAANEADDNKRKRVREFREFQNNALVPGRDPADTALARIVRAMPPAVRDAAMLGITDRVRPRGQPYLSDDDDFFVTQRAIDAITRGVAAIHGAFVDLKTVELPSSRPREGLEDVHMTLADAVAHDVDALKEAAYHMRMAVILYRDDLMRRQQRQ